MISYLETQSLEIYFADNDAPMTGIQRGSLTNEDDQDDDFIGVCKIPLQPLIKNINIIDQFKIIDYKGIINGIANVKISIIDPASSTVNN